MQQTIPLSQLKGLTKWARLLDPGFSKKEKHWKAHVLTGLSIFWETMERKGWLH